MYFFADDYVKFISNLPHYLELQMEPLRINDSSHKDEIKKENANSPLVHIEDVEVILILYKDAEEGAKME